MKPVRSGPTEPKALRSAARGNGAGFRAGSVRYPIPKYAPDRSRALQCRGERLCGRFRRRGLPGAVDPVLYDWGTRQAKRKGAPSLGRTGGWS